MANTEPSNTPGVYRGTMRLASNTELTSELASLQQYIEQIFTGPSGELGSNGYVPWKLNADDSVNYAEMFPELVEAIENHASISIKKDGYTIAENVRSLNFQGMLVRVFRDGEGNVTISVDKDEDTVPRFNEVTTLGNGSVIITSDLNHEMIIPDASDEFIGASPYGDWQPGEVHTGINHLPDDPSNILNIELTTKEPIKASTLSSQFAVTVLDADGNEASHYLSVPITSGLSENDRLPGINESYHPNTSIRVFIKDFKEEKVGWSFVPYFEINLATIFLRERYPSTRFKIKIDHIDDSVTYSYVSDDMFYNMGDFPVIAGNVSFSINTNANSSGFINPEYMWCSGIKYLTKGQIIVSIGPVKNLNYAAAAPVKLSGSVNIADDKFIDFNSLDYSYKLKGDSTWKMTFPIKEGIVESSAAECKLVAFNAMGPSQERTERVLIMANTVRDPEASTGLKETFANEDERLTTDFEMWDSTKSLAEDYDYGTGLMVIPNVGVSYPSGDRTNAMPPGSPDYDQASNLRNKKYFIRKFRGNEKEKFGGIFVFEGISKEKFFDVRLAAEISCNRGVNWLSLQHVRNMPAEIPGNNNSVDITTGILTSIWEKDGKLYDQWSYPGNQASSNEIYFKLRMDQTSDFCIKSIQLLNIDGTEDW